MRCEYNKKQIADCGRIRKWMLEAAAGSIPDARGAQLESHLRDCADCADEFQRVQSLLQAIDEKLNASLAVEPSPALLANTRQAIAAEPRLEMHGWRWQAWLTAVGACAAFAIVLFAAIALHKTNRPSPSNAAQPIIESVTPQIAQPVRPKQPAIDVALNPPRHSRSLLAARRNSPHIRRRAHENEVSEVIVEPGQMQAVMQFVAEVRKGKIDGAQIAAEIKVSDQPIDIKPLFIVPLASPDSARGDGAQSKASGQSNGAR